MECPPLPSLCSGNLVPGMCCPVCAAVLSVLPSQVLVAVNEMYLSNAKLTVSLLCKKLNSLLSLVSVEGDPEGGVGVYISVKPAGIISHFSPANSWSKGSGSGCWRVIQGVGE